MRVHECSGSELQDGALAEFVPSDGPAPDGEEVAMTCTGCGQRFAILMDDLRNTADGVVGGAGSILEDREGLAKGFMPVRMGNPRKPASQRASPSKNRFLQKMTRQKSKAEIGRR
jgi:hypothetical protein